MNHATSRFPQFIANSILLLLSVFITETAFAHGELLIRIGEVTQQINAATNQNAQLYLERAELYRMDQNWAAAEADYVRAEQLAPNLISAQVSHAGMLADSCQFEAALERFNNVLRHSSKNGDVFVGRARVLVKLGQRNAAIADFKRGLELVANPAPEIFVELAEALTAEGRIENALATLDQGIKKLGPVPALQTPAIDLELSRKNYNGALARIDSLLPDLLRKENWLARRGDILIEAGHKADACKSYEAALAAIKALPWRVQQSSPMLRLRAHVDEALGDTAHPALAGK
jgi:tetratricopeptide (TPR) repeat protein